MNSWSPSKWLLAQDCHFAWGLAITFGVCRTPHTLVYTCYTYFGVGFKGRGI